MAQPAPYTTEDFAHSPFVVFYEVTRACDLACAHCRACAMPNAHPRQLSNGASKDLISQIASFPKPPLLIFTGGDPMKRPDIYDLVRHAVDSGVGAAMTPSATPLVTKDAIAKLKDAGLSRLALSIDSADPEVHDAFRGVPGSFSRTLEILADARAVGMPIQINTTITRRNVAQIDAMAERFAGLGIVLWSVFFLVPVGRGLAEERISPEDYETVFEQLWNHAKTAPFAIKTTEAHHYRRFVLERMGNPMFQPGDLPPGRVQRAPLGVNDGKGVFFISHTGTVYPSGFMPIRCGQFPAQSVVDIYQNSPVMQQLRDGDLLKGKCGVCEYRRICGGSRARAYSLTRDPLGAEPDCAYVPAAWKETVSC
ncbi:MAG TPA: TIGR04053 family radical SAM/SPASM domain-containing protein [Armatimonadota bacterium]|jgi:radical SAM protein